MRSQALRFIDALGRGQLHYQAYVFMTRLLIALIVDVFVQLFGPLHGGL